MKPLALPVAAFFIVGGCVAIVALLPPLFLFPWLVLGLKLLQMADKLNDDGSSSS